MTTLPEGHAPQSAKPKITQLIYIAALIAIVAYIIYLLVQKYYYFSEIGFVEVEKITISSTRGGRITSLNHSEGAKIKKGTKLAVIKNQQHCKIEEDTRLEKLAHDIAVDRVLLNSINAQVAENNKAEKLLLRNDDDLYRALELERSILAKTNKAQDANKALSIEADLLRNQIRLKSARLKELSKLASVIKMPEKCYDETLFAPFDATVYSIQRHGYEVITRSESILTLIADNAPVLIEVFLDMEYHPVVMVGDVLELEFPGAIKSSGIIESIQSSAYDSPDRKWEQYKPVAPLVRLHLKPVDEQQSKVWKSFDQMEVKVRGNK